MSHGIKVDRYPVVSHVYEPKGKDGEPLGVRILQVYCPDLHIGTSQPVEEDTDRAVIQMAVLINEVRADMQKYLDRLERDQRPKPIPSSLDHVSYKQMTKEHGRVEEIPREDAILIQEAAKILGWTHRAIQYRADQGLLHSIRKEGGWRVFSRYQCEQIAAKERLEREPLREGEL